MGAARACGHEELLPNVATLYYFEVVVLVAFGTSTEDGDRVTSEVAGWDFLGCTGRVQFEAWSEVRLE